MLFDCVDKDANVLLREETAFKFEILWFKRSFIERDKSFLHIDEYFVIGAGVYFLK